MTKIKLFSFVLIVISVLFLVGVVSAFQITGNVVSVSPSGIATIACQNFPGPSFCPDGIKDVIVTGTDNNGCSTYGCKSDTTACSVPICDGRVDTGKVDANGCTIYSCPANATDVTCEKSECGPELGMPNYLCPDGKTTAGPTGECLRKKNGECVWEILSCPANNTTCPAGCTCNGETTTCPTSQEKPVEVEVSTSSGSSAKVSIGKISENSISLKEGSSSVKTSEGVIFKDKKLFMKSSQGEEQEIKIMPSTASEVAINQLKLKDYSIKLKNVEKPVYEITGKTDVKVLGFIQAEMTTKSQVSAETGKVEKTDKPWWSFLAKEE